MYLRRYVRVSQWREEKYLALLRIADLRRFQGRHQDAVAAGLEALDLIPEWPNACFSLAETFYFLRDWPQVVSWAEAGQARPVPDTVCVMNPRALHYSWIIHYTNALYQVGRVRDGLAWTEKALAICPGEQWHLINHRVFSEHIRGVSGGGPAGGGESIWISRRSKSPAARSRRCYGTARFSIRAATRKKGREFVIGLDALGVPLRARAVCWMEP